MHLLNRQRMGGRLPFQAAGCFVEENRLGIRIVEEHIACTGRKMRLGTRQCAILPDLEPAHEGQGHVDVDAGLTQTGHERDLVEGNVADCEIERPFRSGGPACLHFRRPVSGRAFGAERQQGAILVARQAQGHPFEDRAAVSRAVLEQQATVGNRHILENAERRFRAIANVEHGRNRRRDPRERACRWRLGCVGRCDGSGRILRRRGRIGRRG